MGELKNKLFKGLTDRDILAWQDGKMRYQRKMGRKVTDLEFLRFLLMMNTSSSSIRRKDGVSTGFLSGQGPVHEKGETLLEQYRSHGSMNPTGAVERKPGERRRR